MKCGINLSTATETNECLAHALKFLVAAKDFFIKLSLPATIILSKTTDANHWTDKLFCY